MAHTKSALKRARTSNEDRLRNKAAVSLVKNIQKKMMDAVAAKDLDAATKFYKAYCAALDKAVKKNAITRNTSIRRKARGAAQVRKIKPAA